MNISQYINVPLVAALTVGLCGVFYALSPVPTKPMSIEIPSEVDFGELERNIPAVKELLLKNVSENAVEFKLLGDCDCVAFEPPSGSIPPSETISVKVTFQPVGDDSSQLFQSVTQVIHCETMDDGEYATRPVSLNGTLFSPILYDRAATTVSGYAFAPMTHQISVSLNKAVKRVSVQSYPEFVSIVTIGEIDPVFHGLNISIDMKAQANPQQLAGQLQLDIELEQAADRNSLKALVLVPIAHEVLSPISVQPSQVIAVEPGTYQASIVSKLDGTSVRILEILTSSSVELDGSISLNQREVVINLKKVPEHTRMEQIACRVLVRTDAGDSVMSIVVPVLIMGQ